MNKKPETGQGTNIDPEHFWKESSAGESEDEETQEEIVAEAKEVDASEVILEGDTAVVTSPVSSGPDRRLRSRSTPSPPAATRVKPPPAARPVAIKKAEKRTVGRKVPSWIWLVLVGGGVAFLTIWMVRDSYHTEKTDESSIDRPRAGEMTPKEKPADSEKKKDPVVAQQRANSAKKGNLEVTSDPPGAFVYVNEDRRGVTPSRITEIEVGSLVSLRVEAEGYKPWSTSFTFDAKDLNRKIHAGLQEDKVCDLGSGWVYVTTTPPGATVDLDERRLPGKTPLVINEVCAKLEHVIRIQATGFRSWRRKFSLNKGDIHNINILLEQ